MNAENRMPFWLTITTVLLGVCFCGWQLALYGAGSEASDGYTYFQAWNVIKTFHTDYLRPPVYVVFVGILDELFGRQGCLIIISIVQWAIYIASLQLVWQINRWIGVTPRANIIAILAYLLIPGFWVTNNFAMAESLSGSMIILLVWLSGRYLQTHHKRPLILSGILLATLIMTKPMFVMLLPVMALFWAIVCFRTKRHLKIAGALMLANLALTGGYMWCMNHTYCIPKLSVSTLWNDYYSLRAEGLITPDDFSNPEQKRMFKAAYDRRPSGWPKTQPYWQETWNLNWQQLNELINNVKEKHSDKLLPAAGHRLVRSLSCSQFYNPDEDLGISPEFDAQYFGWNGISKNKEGGFIYPLYHLTIVPILFGMILLMIFSAVWLRRWRRTKSFPALQALLAVILFTAYVTAIVGSPDIWGRIMTPTNTLFPIIAASLLTCGINVKKALSKQGLSRV